MSSNVVSLPRSKVHLSPERPSQIRFGSWTRVADFERLMNWLGPDEEIAGQKYESIRSRLIMMFKARQCIFAEDLADTTIERVARRLSNLTFEFTGDPALYFYGVAKKVYLEHQRKITTERQRSAFSPPTDNGNPDLEIRLKQLDEALSIIPKPDRELILRYYSHSGKNKVNRRGLAEQMGIPANALRLRVFRIRKAIKNYMLGSSAYPPSFTSERLKPSRKLLTETFCSDPTNYGGVPNRQQTGV